MGSTLLLCISAGFRSRSQRAVAYRHRRPRSQRVTGHPVPDFVLNPFLDSWSAARMPRHHQ